VAEREIRIPDIGGEAASVVEVLVAVGDRIAVPSRACAVTS
jgi:hypothetical protein